MKRFFAIIIIIYFCFMPSVYAAEMFSNGWHIIPASDQKVSDSWNNQKKVWALYENGVETKRYGAFIGVHRGWGDAPENSLASFRSTKEHGYYGFETDVRFTKDNVAVLCHDAYINNLAFTKDLKSISGDKVYIKNLTYSQLKNNYIFNIQRLNVDGNKKLSNYNNNRITTFEEMLDFVKQNNMMVSIELKDGSREQIASIVRMADQKGMHNYVRWISFYVNLLEYVKDTDGDELIGILSNSAGQCNNNSNMYCSGDGTSKANNVYNRVKTNNNMVWFEGYTDKYKLPPTNFGNNMPSTKTDTDKKLSNYTLKTISQGKLSINSSIKMNGNDKKEINYNYNGDGTVKCISSNTNIVNCSVDISKKKIIITSKSNSSVTANVNVYATQGVVYSATTDNNISVSITSDNKPVDSTGIVKDIQISGFDFKFNESTHNYKLKINDQTRLNITCDLVNNEYKYTIDGNDYLKDGSVISINIYKNNMKVSTYSITVEKSTNNVPYREVSPVESSTSSETTTNIVSANESNSMSSVRNTNNNTTSTTTSSREYSTPSEKAVNTNNNSTTVTVLKADTPTTNSSNVTPKIVSVPNTDQYNNMIYYMIALSLFVLSFYVIKSYRKKIKN